MIQVLLNKEQFLYDIHSLVKSFYPEEDVKIKTTDVSENSDIHIQFFEQRIVISVTGEDGSCRQTETEVDANDRPETKNRLKQSLYLLLSEMTGTTLPWGDLTGIRPTKIPMTMLMEGKSKEEIRNYMKETYLIGDDKMELSIEIAEREKQILEPIHYEQGYSLYIGIPFCPTTCLYCSFTSYPIASWKKRVGEYLDALEREMDFTSSVYKDHILDTVYIGGGTPTTLSPSELDRLLTSLEQKFDLSQIKELTVESGRPDSITLEKLEVLKKHHVTRISINPQTMKEETLKIIGRHHTVEQTIEAFHLSRKAGFDNINMDLIMGLPGENLDDVAHTLSVIRDLSPDSLTVHSLAVKRASGLNQWMEENGRDSIHNTPQMMELTEKFAAENGLLPYYLYRQKNMAGNFENVGYAKPGKYGIYNILIMEEKQDIVALGAGTVSKVVRANSQIERVDNVKDVALYLERFDAMIEKKKQFYKTYQ